MADIGYQRHLSKSESGFLTNSFGMAAQNKQADTAPKTTLMQKIQPQKSYSVNSVNAAGLKNSVQHKNSGGDQMKQATGAMKGQVAAQKAEMKKDYMAAKQEAYNEVKNVAEDKGMDMKGVNASLAPDVTASNAAVIASLAVDSATAGLGTMAVGTAGAAIGSIQDLIGESKKLKPDEMKSLMEDTMRSLQSKSSADFFGQTQNTAPKADWDSFEAEDLQELLQGSIDDLPEMKELNDVEFALNQAEQIQSLNDSQESIDYDGSKIEMALESGHHGLLEAFKQADSDGKITSKEFSSLRDELEADILEDNIVTVDEINMYVNALYDISGIKLGAAPKIGDGAPKLKNDQEIPQPVLNSAADFSP